MPETFSNTIKQIKEKVIECKKGEATAKNLLAKAEETKATLISLQNKYNATVGQNANNYAEIGGLLKTAKQQYQEQRNKLNKTRKKKKLTWTAYIKSDEFKQKTGIRGRTVRRYIRFHDNYNIIKNYWSKKTGTDPPINMDLYMITAIGKDVQSTDNTTNNRNTRKPTKQRCRTQNNIQQVDDNSHNLDNSPNHNNRNRKRCRQNTNNPNSRPPKKRRVAPEEPQNIIDKEIYAFNSMVKWCHGKKNNYKGVQCQRCGGIINSYENPGIKMRHRSCCNKAIHGACKVVFDGNPARCEFCLQTKTFADLAEFESEANKICIGYWLFEDAFLIKLQDGYYWVTKQNLIQIGAFAFIAVESDKFHKIWVRQTQHRLIENDVHIEGRYEHTEYELPNGLKLHVHNYKGM